MLMARNFPALKEEQKVQQLQKAFSGDAERFFFEINSSKVRESACIASRTTRWIARYASSPVNIYSLSLALHEIEQRFCTRQTKAVLYQKLQQLTLAKIRSTLGANDNAEAVRLKTEVEDRVQDGKGAARISIRYLSD